MVAPIIAISMDHVCDPDKATLRDVYYDAIFASGGIPLLIPPIAEPRYLETIGCRIDGLVMPGSDDLHPSTWGNEPVHPSCTLVTDRRQRFDLMLIAFALRQQLPLLAICGSMQALNVVCGGTVIQHLANATAHRLVGAGEPISHLIDVEPGTRLAEALGQTRVHVNSYHHQSCGRIGEALRIAARTADGVVEAIETQVGFALGVQWHPEKILDEPSQRRLFATLCSQATKRAERSSTRRAS